jgi:hypothetical protein
MQHLPTDEQRAFATLVLDGLVKQATADYGGE